MITGVTGRLVEGSWSAGIQTISVSAQASSGISLATVLIDGSPVAQRRYNCQLACPDLLGSTLSIDTRRLHDGSHPLVVEISDASGQSTRTASRRVYVSNTVPGRVSLQTNIGSVSGWTRMPAIGIGWKRQTTDPAPITQTFYTLDHQPSSSDATVLNGDPLHMTVTPADGIHTLWVWQEDAAGNVGLAAASSVTIKVDRSPPVLGTPQVSGGGDTASLSVSDPVGSVSVREAQAVDVGQYDPYRGDALPLRATNHRGTIVLSLPSPLRLGLWQLQIRTRNGIGDAGVSERNIGTAVPPPPVNQSLPTITGQPLVGSTLVANPGTWTNDPASYSYVWESCASSGTECALIGGANAPTLTVSSAQVGHTLRVLVVAANATSSGQALSSATVAASPGSAPGEVGRRSSSPPAGPLGRPQAQYLATATRGVALAGRYWGNHRFHWYNALLKDPQPYPQATIWDIVPLFESLDEIAIASPTAKNRRAVTRFARHAEDYWDAHVKPGPGYAPYPGSHNNAKTYFDDNSWWGLAFMDAYQATANTRYLRDAERAMGFVTAYSWDHGGGGGLWWNTAHPWRSGEAIGAATDLASRLYESTGTIEYLQTADRYITWASKNLLKWDGTYARRIPNEGTMPHDGEGALLAAFTTLCQSGAPVPVAVYDHMPHNSFHLQPSARRPADPTSWCSWAESLANKTVFGVPIGTRIYDAYVPVEEGPQWDAIYIRGLLTLYGYDRNARWYNVAVRTAQRIMHNSVDSRGLFLKAWNGSRRIDDGVPNMLRTHAASVSVFAALAATPPPVS